MVLGQSSIQERRSLRRGSQAASQAQDLEGEVEAVGLFAREPKTFGGVPWESRIDKELGKRSGFSIGPNMVPNEEKGLQVPYMRCTVSAASKASMRPSPPVALRCCRCHVPCGYASPALSGATFGRCAALEPACGLCNGLPDQMGDHPGAS